MLLRVVTAPLLPLLLSNPVVELRSVVVVELELFVVAPLLLLLVVVLLLEVVETLLVVVEVVDEVAILDDWVVEGVLLSQEGVLVGTGVTPVGGKVGGT